MPTRAEVIERANEALNAVLTACRDGRAALDTEEHEVLEASPVARSAMAAYSRAAATADEEIEMTLRSLDAERAGIVDGARSQLQDEQDAADLEYELASSGALQDEARAEATRAYRQRLLDLDADATLTLAQRQRAREQARTAYDRALERARADAVAGRAKALETWRRRYDSARDRYHKATERARLEITRKAAAALRAHTASMHQARQRRDDALAKAEDVRPALVRLRRARLALERDCNARKQAVNRRLRAELASLPRAAARRTPVSRRAKSGKGRTGRRAVKRGK